MKVRRRLKSWHKTVLIIILVGFVGGMLISVYGSVIGDIGYSFMGAIFTFIMLLLAGTIVILHFIRWGDRWMRQ